MGGMMHGGYDSYMSDYWFMGGWIGLLINVALIVGVVLLVVWAVKSFSRSTNQTSAAAGGSVTSQLLSAREILDIRYARGELTREEYQTMLNDIS